MARQMKDSGIEWIGEIPEEWEVARLKQMFDFGKGLPITKDNLVEKGIPVISYGQIHSKLNTGVAVRQELIRYVPETFRTTNSSSFVSKNDFIFADTSEDLLGCGNCTFIDQDTELFAGYHTIILRAVTKNDNKYLAYLFLTDTWRSQIRAKVSGVKLFSISRKILSEATLLLPPAATQRRIAAFLDSKCAEIDAVSERTKTTIEEYKRLKQAVITEAVTKGVRGARKMKDSGIEWIGEISETHPLIKLKHICQILDQYRSPVTADQRSQSGDVLYDYYGASGAIDKIDGYTIDDHVMLIGEDGANLRLRNLPLMYEVNGKAWVNNHAHILKPHDNTDFYYLFYALEALDINPYITGSAQPKLSQENLKNILVPMPSLNEQRAIATYIREKCAAIDALIARKTTLLAQLEAYKKSLIYEYVTGKKEVV